MRDWCWEDQRKWGRNPGGSERESRLCVCLCLCVCVLLVCVCDWWLQYLETQLHLAKIYAEYFYSTTGKKNVKELWETIHHTLLQKLSTEFHFTFTDKKKYFPLILKHHCCLEWDQSDSTGSVRNKCVHRHKNPRSDGRLMFIEPVMLLCQDTVRLVVKAGMDRGKREQRAKRRKSQERQK